LPNVGPYVYDVSISGFTRSSIYIYDISSLRVNTPPAIPPSLHPRRFAHLAATIEDVPPVYFIEESDCSQLGPPGTITEY